MNIGIIIAGNVKNDEANITGITPAIANFNGICVFCPPYIFLPTTFLAYCTGTLLSACCTNTTPATSNNAPIIIAIDVIKPVVLNPIPVTNINLYIVVTADGNEDIIPINIINDIPFPIPLFVICSPSHISNAVPATNDITTRAPVVNPWLINTPYALYALLYVKYRPIASIKANTNVNIFVYLLIFSLPSSPPSLINFSNEGITIPNNWITIDAVIYGVIDIANIENLENAPPEIISIKPDILAVDWDVILCNAKVSTPGTDT